MIGIVAWTRAGGEATPCRPRRAEPPSPGSAANAASGTMMRTVSIWITKTQSETSSGTDGIYARPNPIPLQ